MSAAQHFTLPRHYYCDPDIFRREMETIFAREWIWVGRAEAMAWAGDFLVREIAGESVILTRDGGGEIRAFYNVCRHRGTRLCVEASGSFAGRIQCPYHGWSYGLDGRLLGAPHMDATSFRAEDYPLHGIQTGTWDGHVFVNLGAPATGLREHLGGLPAKFAHWGMEDLRLHRRIIYEVQANWKLIVSNYNECLHCPLLHPALNRLTNYLGADNDPPAATYVGGSMGFRDEAETMSLDGRRRRDYLPSLTEEERRMVAYYAVYPNLLLSLHPDYMMLHSLWPKGLAHTQVICEWYFHPEEMAKPHFIAEDAVEFWDVTNREDWRISELSQAGIESRAYTPGPYSQREVLLHAFDEYIVRHVG